jgi:hypothetical protein
MHTIIRLLMILVFLEAMADVVTTSLALKLPNVKEANPVIAFVMRAVGSKWVIVRLVIALAAITSALSSGDKWPALLVLLLNFAVMVWVILNNLKVIKANRPPTIWD